MVLAWSGGVFFVQAEDGIRDYKVTGVQTCALRIFGVQRSRQRDRGRVRAAPAERRDVHRLLREPLEAGDDRDVALGDGVLDPARRDVDDEIGRASCRERV